MTKASIAFRLWFEAFIDHWHGFAKEEVESDEEVSSALFIVRAGDQEIAVMPVDMGNRIIREATTTLQATLAKDEDLIEGVILMMPAWSVVIDKVKTAKEAFAQLNGQSLDDHPDKQEVVIWSAMRGTQQLIAYATIVPAPAEKPGVKDLLKRTLAPATILDPSEGGHHGPLTGSP